MNTTAAVAAIIAAIAGVVGVIITRRETHRRRLVEIIDLLTEIKAAIDWGSTASLKRDELQGKLRTRLAGLDLPKTCELANTALRSETLYSNLAADALAEARAALARGRWRPV